MNDKNNISSVELEAMHDEAFRWACSCCHYNEDHAKEVMQLVYLEIISNKAVFRGESAPRTWLFGVIRNVALRFRRTIYSADLFKERLALLIDDDQGFDNTLNVQERDRQAWEVTRAMGRLPVMQRQIIELIYYREFTLAEAASILGIGIGSARTHFHRAKQALSGLLRDTQN